MFSGIIESTQYVIATEVRGKCQRVRISKPPQWKLMLGESVNIDGICSTVVATGAKSFDVEYMPETLSKTTAAQFAEKRMVNLERSLVYGVRVHGHFVAGHVDAAGVVQKIEPKGRSKTLVFAIPRELKRFVVPRGSVTINGVSLTVANVRSNSFDVSLIPHTLAATNLGALKVGDPVNIECDLLARYGHRGINARVVVHAKKRISKSE